MFFVASLARSASRKPDKMSLKTNTRPLNDGKLYNLRIVTRQTKKYFQDKFTRMENTNEKKLQKCKKNQRDKIKIE